MPGILSEGSRSLPSPRCAGRTRCRCGRRDVWDRQRWRASFRPPLSSTGCRLRACSGRRRRAARSAACRRHESMAQMFCRTFVELCAVTIYVLFGARTPVGDPRAELGDHITITQRSEKIHQFTIFAPKPHAFWTFDLTMSKSSHVPRGAALIGVARPSPDKWIANQTRRTSLKVMAKGFGYPKKLCSLRHEVSAE